MTTLQLTRKPGLSREEAEAEAEQALAARKHLLPFAQYTMATYKITPHLEMAANALEAVERGEIKRLLIEFPPRHGKSELVSARFPPWFILRNPDKYFISATYGDILASFYGRRARNIMMLDRVREIFPGVELAHDSKAANLWHTTAGGQYLTTSIGGAITGMGGHILSVDDPIKKREEAESPIFREKVWQWWQAEALTRLEPDGAVILTLTPWHSDDLAGRVIAEQGDVKEGGVWTVIRLPATGEKGDPLGREEGEALWPERFDEEALAGKKSEIGEREWAALYQCRPAPAEGAVWKWFPRYEELPVPQSIVIAIDTAYTESKRSDYTAWAAWGKSNGRGYLIEADHFRGEIPAAERYVKMFYESMKHRYSMVPIRPIVRRSVAIDRVSSQHLRDKGVPVIPVKLPGGDTEALANMIAPDFEASRMLIPERASWLEAWLQEHLQFPGGTHDDFVETTITAGWFMFHYITSQQRRDRIDIYGSY